MNLRRYISLLFAIMILSTTGCLALTATAVGGGVAGIAYARGRYTQQFAADVDMTAAAALAALQDIGMPADKRNIGRSKGEIDSWTPSRHPIMIDLEAVPGQLPKDPPETRVGIRVGPFGDSKLSQRIFDQIQYRLEHPEAPATTPQAPPPPEGPQTGEPPLAQDGS